MTQLTPLYELLRLIRQAEAELEEMRKNPEVSKEEITEVERELARHKAEFEEGGNACGKIQAGHPRPAPYP